MHKQMYIEPCQTQLLNNSNTNHTLQARNYSIYKIIDDTATLLEFANENHPLHLAARERLKQYEEAKVACFTESLELGSVRNDLDESKVIEVLKSKNEKSVAWGSCQG